MMYICLYLVINMLKYKICEHYNLFLDKVIVLTDTHRDMTEIIIYPCA